ncbi:ATP-dependent Clp protease proteolytic subunit 1 [Kitasatospora phosalacinea]|uniref:ATP-dependent Clp protease proteolytic subunit n=1 Tax=Kitasatospora phosalacinea TaxID=2065 RepID=A0A9W6QBI9_9ACTN|nr:ATP-dependent Clp protease proteolytic subunit [Kitasatospora phosalacinea]GLW72039.1 ATP-dependent Clp protease proteolytic subunit 1 [Kitasatospora phosalacinea]
MVHQDAGERFSADGPRADAGAAPWGVGDQVFSRLLRDRIVFLGQAVDDDIANKLTAQLLMLAAESEEDIYLYINSPGGSITAGMAVYDTMQYIRNDVVTIAMGFCASMGQFLLTAGAAGKRFALPHTKILMHQPSAGLAGSASDIRIYAQQLLRTKLEMAELIAAHSGQDVDKITKDSDRDRWFTAQEAMEYGLIDKVMQSTASLPGGGGGLKR